MGEWVALHSYVKNIALKEDPVVGMAVRAVILSLK
jgi:hypothetical protein